MFQKYFLALLAACTLLATAPLAAQAQTGGVRIGTPGTPDVSAALDIVSSSKGALLPRVADATAIATPATGLLVFQTGGTPGFYYNAGTPSVPNWQQLATAAGVPTLTAGNGLTKTGNTIVLGGTLTQATTVAQGGNNFSLTGGNVGIGTSSPAGLLTVQGSVAGAAAADQQQRSASALASDADAWQSFTPGVSGTLTQLDLLLRSPTGASGATGTLSIYAGQGTGGALLTSQPLVLNPVNYFEPHPLTAPVAVVAGQTYTYRIQVPSASTGYLYFAPNDPYAGGQSSTGGDLCFISYVAPTLPKNVLTATAGGNVGVGTTTPSQALEVTGQVFSNSGGFRFPDNTVQTTAAISPVSTASNGLTKTGQNIVLGGTLTQATTISQGGNTFSLSNNGTSNAAVDQQQLVSNGSGSFTDIWQSFTAGVGGLLTRLDLDVSSPTTTPVNATLSVYAGNGTGGALLTTQAVVLTYEYNRLLQFPLTSPVPLAAGQQYTYRLQAAISQGIFNRYANGNPYAGGSYGGGTADCGFITYVAGTTNVLTALASGNVGIGTSSPTQLLEVAGQVFSNSGGFRFPDNTVQTTAAISPVATASNGLTQSGNDVALGGTLTQATTIAQGGNSFSLTGGNVGIGTSSPTGLLTVQSGSFGSSAIDQQQLATSAGLGGNTDNWQSFTAGVTGNLVQLDLRVSSPNGPTPAQGTLSIYAGEGTGGSLLSSQAITYNSVANTAYQSYVLATPVAVVAGQQYTYRFEAPSYGASGPGTPFISLANYNPYAGGRSNTSASWDDCFKTYVTAYNTTAVLTALASGNVGIGTASPAGGLQVLTGNGGVTGGVSGAVLSGAPGANPYLELRGSSGSTAVTPYIDFAETNGVDYSTRLRSIGGVLNVEGANSATSPLFRVNGGVQATNVTYTSDARFKQNVRPLTSALASVLALRGVRYEWNALGVRHGGRAGAGQVGVIAQEIEKIYPELVATDQDGYKSVNYAQLAPVLLEAIKELAVQNDALKAQAAAAKAEAAAAKAQAATATATTEAFEARLRRLEAAGAQAQR